MDYLQEGIKPPGRWASRTRSSEWQREGFNMFEAMMGQIEDDFVQYGLPSPGRGRRPAPEPARQRAVQRGRAIRSRVRARSRARWAAEAQLMGAEAAAGPEAIAANEPEVVQETGPGREDSRSQRNRASAGVARSTSCATVVEMRDFSEGPG